MSDVVEQTMSRFPGPVVLQSSPWPRWIVFAIGSGGMAFAVGFAVTHGGGWAWVMLIPILPVFVVLLLMLRGGNTLTLDAAGMEMQYLFGRMRTSWSDAGDFTTVDFRGDRIVAFNDANRDGNRLAKLNLAALGRNTTLPGSPYRMSPPEFADLLTRWCVRATAGAHAPAQRAAPSVADRVTVSTPARRLVRGGLMVLRIIAIVAGLIIALVTLGQLFH
jgi:hypothetical protein